MDVVTNSEVAQLWRRGGGEMAQPLAQDRRFAKEAIQDMLSQTPKDKALNWARHPVDSLRSVLSITESVPRLAEVRAAWTSLGWKPGQPLTFEQYIKGQLASANVSVDFREGGTLAMWVNQVNPFFNSNIQGPARMVSTLRNRPSSAAIAFMWITLPTLYLWWKQKDEEWYKQLTPMERFRYWHIRAPGTNTVIRIPKPFEWGHVFSSIPEAIMEYAYTKNPQAISEAIGVAISSTAPNIIPASGALQPPIEVFGNKDIFFDRPIVPERMEKMLPKDQYSPYTSETAKKIGAALGSETAKKIGKTFGFDPEKARYLSPANLEHLASGWTGGMLPDVIKTVESLVGAATHKTQRQITGGASTIPVVGRLFLSPTHTRVMDDFYTKLGQMEKEYGSANATPPGIAASDSLRAYRNAAEKLRELRAEERKVIDNAKITDDQKRDRFMEIHKQMVEIAKKANENDWKAPPRKKLGNAPEYQDSRHANETWKQYTRRREEWRIEYQKRRQLQLAPKTP